MTRLPHRAALPGAALLLLLTFAAAGCGDDETTASPGDATPLPDAGGRDAAPSDATLPNEDAETPHEDAEAPREDAEAPREDTGEEIEDAAPDVAVDDGCDEDGDGARSRTCGGRDCNDVDPTIGPDAQEACDFLDNNCDGSINEGLDCTFYAHSPDRLYRVDPFLGTSTEVGPVPTDTLDFDTAPDGTLYAIQGAGLYRWDGSTWGAVGSARFLGAQPNAFAINGQSIGFAVGGSQLYRVDLSTGTVTPGPTIQGGHLSSGDVVLTKADTFYMSARTGGNDRLVLIDPATGSASVIGDLGVVGIYGLTAGWGFLFGLTGDGRVVEIDPATAATRERARFNGVAWYGAASNPER